MRRRALEYDVIVLNGIRDEEVNTFTCRMVQISSSIDLWRPTEKLEAWPTSRRFIWKWDVEDQIYLLSVLQYASVCIQWLVGSARERGARSIR